MNIVPTTRNVTTALLESKIIYFEKERVTKRGYLYRHYRPYTDCYLILNAVDVIDSFAEIFDRKGIFRKFKFETAYIPAGPMYLFTEDDVKENLYALVDTRIFDKSEYHDYSFIMSGR